jgi:hypothetical protein
MYTLRIVKRSNGYIVQDRCYEGGKYYDSVGVYPFKSLEEAEKYCLLEFERLNPLQEVVKEYVIIDKTGKYIER